MARTYTAQSVGKNHDWDFSVDEKGKITALVIRSEVNYGTVGMMESLDIWGVLNTTQKARIQTAYDLINQRFNNQFLGES